MSDVLAPTVYITPEAKIALDFYIKAAPEEISGYGTVEQISEDVFVINDVYTFSQVSSGAATDISGEDLAKGLLELYNSGRVPNPENMRLWWHSHVNMASRFSSTDDHTMNETFNDIGWFISVVGNKKGEYNVRFDMHKPVRFYADGMNLLPLSTGWVKCSAFSCKEFFEADEDPKKTPEFCTKHAELYSEILAEVKEKVAKPAPIVLNRGKGAYTYGYSFGEGGVRYGRGYTPPDPNSKNSRKKAAKRAAKNQDKVVGIDEFKYCKQVGCVQTMPESLDHDYCMHHRDQEDDDVILMTSSVGAVNVGDCDIPSCQYEVTVDDYFDGMFLCGFHYDIYQKMLESFGNIQGTTDELVEFIETFENEFTDGEGNIDEDIEDQSTIREYLQTVEEISLSLKMEAAGEPVFVDEDIVIDVPKESTAIEVAEKKKSLMEKASDVIQSVKEGKN